MDDTLKQPWDKQMLPDFILLTSMWSHCPVSQRERLKLREVNELEIRDSEFEQRSVGFWSLILVTWGPYLLHQVI